MTASILSAAKRYWHVEIIGSLDKPFSWRRVFQKCRRSNRYRYIFWFRLAYVLHAQGNKFLKRRGKLLNEKISREFNVEIMLGATIGEGLWIAHPTGIVITSHAEIGKNFKIWQNCTIGIKGQSDDIKLVIGDGVRVHAHSCIISDNLELGDNVVVGAGSFINKSVPAGHVVFNSRDVKVQEYDVKLMGRLQQ
ncbi:serine O-acetyltransferase [Pseudomonas sp. PDM09]|uniref:serine O-acetyltransferase n=1 Tax=Pseudomonas sp. PDM09 TaxID=2769270 RepID=UPI0017838875|nr:serine acetyltransferase [Pseudomonas sp. PDM09]MBD9562487.1 serine acetyltransferase [Pseudomonas sp. PDM09]